MAGNASSTDSTEARKPGGTRKRRRLEKLPTLIGEAEERELPVGAARESTTGGLAATWNASQASVERGATLLPGWLRRLGYYGLALLFVTVAATLRWAMGDTLSPAPTLVFYLAWVGAAAFGGLGPGLLATVASWACIDLLFDSTPGQIGFSDPGSVGRLMVLLAGGLVVSLVGEKMRRARLHERRQSRELAIANAALRERMKELRCLYAVSRDLQEDLSIDELCWRAVEHLVPAMQFPEITVPVIELKGKRFTSKNYAEGLSHDLHAQIRVEGEVLGHLRVRYTQERPFLIPEEQNLVNGVAEALSTWLEHKQAEEALRELNATLESKVAQRTAELEHRARQLQKLTLDLSEAEDRERKRLAEILHDDLQQILAAAKFHLGLMSNRCKNDKTLQETTKRVEQLLVEAIGKSRSLSRELRPPGLAQSDLRETFEWLASQVQAKHGLTVHLDVRDRLGLQSEPIKTLLYKAAQEMLFNVVKHAQVREARLRLRRRRGNICLAVSDKGRGFDPQGLGGSAGSGLLSIRERVNLLGGRMKVRSTRGKGSTFLIAVPDAPQQTGQTDHL
jgi:signal transduction histidine kinase